jgi:hypothetical protein
MPTIWNGRIAAIDLARGEMRLQYKQWNWSRSDHKEEVASVHIGLATRVTASGRGPVSPQDLKVGQVVCVNYTED